MPRDQRTFRLRYNSSNIQYDVSGTYPTPTGGDNGNVWFNGDGGYGALEIWVNDSGEWIKIGGDLGQRPFMNKTSQSLPQQSPYFDQGTIAYAMN